MGILFMGILFLGILFMGILLIECSMTMRTLYMFSTQKKPDNFQLKLKIHCVVPWLFNYIFG